MTKVHYVWMNLDYSSMMQGILSLNLALLFHGLILNNADGKAWINTSLDNTEPVKLSNIVDEKYNKWNSKQPEHRVSYNPVLQNFSSLFDYLNVEHGYREDQRAIKSRQKRSRGRNCSGQCEHSLCPWREVWDEERTRIPQFVKYAVCDSPACNYASVGLDFASSFILGMRTHCDLVKIDIRVTEDGQEKWLTNWPIACVCTKREIHTDFAVQFRHPGRNSERVDVDITSNVSLEPVSRQRISLQGGRHRSLSRAQSRRLRNQRRNMQNAESWEQIMERKNNIT